MEKFELGRRSPWRGAASRLRYARFPEMGRRGRARGRVRRLAGAICLTRCARPGSFRHVVGDKANFGVAQAAGITALYLVISGLGSAALERLLRSLGPDHLGESDVVLAALLGGFAIAAGLVLWRERSVGRWRCLTRADLHLPAGALVAWLVVVAGQGFFLAEVDNWFRALWAPPEALVALFDRIMNVRESPLLVIATVAVVGPIAEEVVMRGVVLRGLLRTMAARRAIVWSAVLFSAMHLNPWQMLPTFFIGLLLGWAYERTGSLGLCLVAHILNNGLSVAVLAWTQSSEAVARLLAQKPGEFQPWWITAAGLGALAGGLWLFVRATPVPPRLAAVAPGGPEERPS